MIHADYHGAVVVPADAVKKLPAAIDLISRREKVILDVCRDPGFTPGEAARGAEAVGRDPLTGAATVIRNADMVVAWDAAAKSHVYMPDADVAFEGGVLRFVGRGYDGPADEVISGSGMMVMPGLVNIHSHPSSEPMNKGLIDEIGSPGLLQFLALRVPADLPRRCGGDSALRARGAVGAAAVGRDHARRSVDGASRLARSAGREPACASASRRCSVRRAGTRRTAIWWNTPGTRRPARRRWPRRCR